MLRRRRSVGVDIGTAQVKLVELEGPLARPRLVNFGVTRLLPGAIELGHPQDLPAVGDALRLLWSKYALPTREVVVNIGKGEVFAQRIRTESVPAAELERRIDWEAASYLPFDAENATIEFQILGPAAPLQDVLLIAARTDLVEDRATIIESAGLKLRALEADLVALHHVIERRPGGASDAFVLDLGASMTAAAIFIAGKPYGLRLFDHGVKDIVRQLEDRTGFDFAACQSMLALGLAQPEVADACAEFAALLRDKIASALRFLPAPAPAFGDILLTGGGFLLPGWRENLAGQLDRPVAFLDPTPGFEIALGARGAEFASQSSLYAVACGLALRGLL